MVNKVFEQGKKLYSLKKSNESKRLQNKINSYNNSIRNNSKKNLSIANSNVNNANKNLNDRINFNRKNSMSKSGMPGQKGSAMRTSGVNSNNKSDTTTSENKTKTNTSITDMAKKRFMRRHPLARLLSNNGASASGERNTEETYGPSMSNFQIPLKLIKWALIAGGPVFTIIIFCCLFISASQVYLNAISLGNADSVSAADAEQKIKSKDGSGIGEYKDDEDLSYDNYIDDTFNTNLMKVNSTIRKYNEADLMKLRDYYPGIENYIGDNNEETVYNFFFKLYDLYNHYNKPEYDNVKIDMPLLMSTLRLQSSDMAIVFKSNAKTYDRGEDSINKLDYYYNWDGYKIEKNNSEHDIELLAQHMISKQSAESCTDSSGRVVKKNILRGNQIGSQTLTCGSGETYSATEGKFLIDDELYREFLKEFLEKKYYLKGDNYYHRTAEENNIFGNAPDSNPSSTPGNGDSSGTSGNGDSGGNTTTSNFPSSGNKYADAIVDFAYNEKKINKGKGGAKYNSYFGFSAGTMWCSNFVSYVIANTEVNGKKIYPSIIPFKSASCTRFSKSFHDSKEPNIKFYYNNHCSRLKNLSSKNYNPKKGDIIFFDFHHQFVNVVKGESHHVGIVTSYRDGTIHTIEGNTGSVPPGKIGEHTYNINSCTVVGFGSWY